MSKTKVINLDLRTVLIIANKELRDAKNNKWMIVYTIVFVILSFVFAWIDLSQSHIYGAAGFGRTAATLINIIILIIPLMGLSLGALLISSEHENGNLLYLIAQPITRVEYLLGKYLGISLSLTLSLLIGFGISGILISFKVGSYQITNYIYMIALSTCLALISISIGLLISVITKKSITSLGLALFTWLLFVFFTDLGIMGTSLILKLNVNQLFTISLINPLQVFKILSILVLNNNLEVLGPGGIYAMRTYGQSLIYILLIITALFICIPLIISCYILKNKRDF
jgi:Cu-processing system permease protein|tara:strand:+ start:53 stop:907 length:855 start_codon:yes stop_codon:yes gene_type:complete